MSVCVTPNRITSEKIRIDWLPLSCTVETHVQELQFESTLTGGTFRLRVNGEETANITYNSTIATLLTNINNALDALDVLGAGDIVATGTLVTAVTLTAIADGFYKIELSDIAGLTGNSTNNPNLTTTITTQGSDWFTLSAELSSFGWEESVETVDVTAISEYARTEIPVASTATISATMYKADTSWKHAVYAGAWGIIQVYPQGKFDGEEYFSGRILIESVSEDYPDHEVVERDISGMRQGEWIVPPQSKYKV